MNTEDNKTLLAMMKYMIRLHCRHEVTRILLLGSLSKDPAIVGKLMESLDQQAKKLEEDILLKIGDSDPQSANLLGIQEFLSKLGDAL